MTTPALFVPPTAANSSEWMRKTATAVNWLLSNFTAGGGGGGGGGGSTLALDGGGATSSGTPAYTIDGGAA